MSCPECGAPGVDDIRACEALFREVCVHEFEQASLFSVHALTVDAYSLQHPDAYMKSTKSAAAHLVGMAWRVERGAGPGASRRISAWLDGGRRLPRITPPERMRRGSVTIRDVHDVAGAAEHPDRVRAWADDVWAAWGAGHDQARRWLEEIVAPRRGEVDR